MNNIYNFIKGLPFCAFVIDNNFMITCWNNEMSTTTKIENSECLGKSIFEYYPILQDDIYKLRIINTINGGSASSLSPQLHRGIIPITKIDGREMIQEIIILGLLDEISGERLAVFIIRDVTDENDQIANYRKFKEKAEREILFRKILQEQNEVYLNKIEKSNEALSHFAHAVSHDIKAPLNSANWLIDIISDKGKSANGKETTAIIGNLRNVLGKMEEMVDGLLEYSIVTSTNKEMQDVDVKEVIENVVKTLLPNKIELSIPENIPTIFGDKTKLNQIFQNLIRNAIKYNDKDNCKIDINYSVEEKMHIFKIKDNGIGIAEKNLTKIFELFKTVHGTKRKDSTGVGLAIVKRLVEDLGGEIKVNSTLGKGTEFTFSLKNSVE